MAIKCPKCDTENPSDSKFCKECATPLPSSKEIPVTETLETPKEELTTGSTFAGRYQIIEELGKGGMGKVYKVHDTEIKEKVALKLLKPEIAADEKTIERFRNEIKLARKIVHKNVGRMYDLGKAEGSYYITMEFVPGQDLRGLIRQSRQLTVGTSISIAKQVCEGLTEAHKLGVVHRDLKPSNIMIDKEGNARIMDFGIARSLKAKGITGAGVMIGTPEYMSPEQVEGKEVDQRSDIYSLGIILYEMVTGRVPFEGDTPLSIAVKHKTETPRNPKEVNAQIPEDLSRVSLRCLEKDKEQRYQSAGEVRAELENIEKGIPSTERVVPKRKPITSKEITVTFGLKKLFITALVVVLLVIAMLLIWKPWSQKEAVSISTSNPSIAVLPFEDISPQKDQEYFCDGMANSIINTLSTISGLSVRARGSSFSFKGRQRDIKEIGKRLNVETVLEGSVQKVGSRLRITAQLINVSDESLLWSEQYNRELDDIFAIQDEITLAIVNKLKIRLFGEEKAELLKHHTENLEAHNLYLQGLHHWNKFTEEDVKKSINYFEQTIEKDPNFALAYTGIADCYILFGLGHGSGTHLPIAMYKKAKQAVTKALKIDNTLGEGHSTLGFINFAFEFDWVRGEQEFKLAIQLSPSLAQAHTRFALLLSCLGRHDEAIETSKRGQELDPLSPILYSDAGFIYLWGRQYDKAIAPAKKALELDPDFLPALDLIAMVYLRKGMFEEAIKEMQGLVALSGERVEYIARLGNLYALIGRRDDARKILQELLERSRRSYVSSYDIARVYIGLREKTKAIHWLEKAYQERAFWIAQLKIDEDFDVLNSDPRFVALLKKMGLE